MLKLSKKFWNLIKHFLFNKGGLAGNNIIFVTGEKIVTDELALSDIFHNHYANIIEKMW